MTDHLFDMFEGVSTKEWKQKIQFDLKGADYNKTLLTDTPEHITIKPFYHPDDLSETTAAPTASGSWSACERIYVANEEKAIQKARLALDKGAESLHLVLHNKTTDLHKVFSQTDAPGIPVYLEMHFLSTEKITELLKAAGSLQQPVHLLLDPIGDLNASGNWHYNRKKDMKLLAEILKMLTDENIPGSDFVRSQVGVNMSRYLNSGASAVQQLAYGMAHVNEYLNLMEENELDATLLSPLFYCGAGHHYFFEIAKLRALRILWKTLATAYNNPNAAHILATPGKRNKTLYDYNVNMLRTTTEYMSAVIGGADAVCALPYDSIYHKDNAFGSRIARNQLLILKHESYFKAVNNAADGSYYIESVTAEMAEKALDIFKQIEAGGGYLQQLMDGAIQKKIKETAREEQEAFEKEERTLVGTNKYINPEDSMKNNLELDPFLKKEAVKTLVEPIIEKRLAEQSEKKRLKQE
ncbi:methylmalonyl-CoA mutase [Robertkochia marina]|uniref:Methylmalonyl-CoA mutase n=1 Tax=Robertkochia marina TaxID=1227945 RepID=A0A4S3M0W3_9FLAO|nr:methylmalonyl-CoA mutase subunit beta [Robertkochia marina]THD66593.1 methylmalonyl-CoA mutase [Robertkochia marina]TRZ45568.1 methylmalonyl-CoA mutase [Robertkochia marina]